MGGLNLPNSEKRKSAKSERLYFTGGEAGIQWNLMTLKRIPAVGLTGCV